MKNNPLISFCIATYKRETFLPKTIQSILDQKYKNIEIIVSDNDPEGSAKKIVKKFKKKNIIYNKNSRNIGTVKNFNKALSLSSGDFIVFLSDDDPVEQNMLSTLIPLYRQYPDYDGFFGASNIYIPDESVAKLYGFPVGKTSLISKLKKKDEITLYNQSNFLEKFLTYQVTSYILWSGGFARRSLVKKIGGMPDYQSTLLTDFAYIAKLGAVGKMLYINTPVGYQTFHKQNSGRDLKSLKTLPFAVVGFHKLIHPHVSPATENLYRTYLINWVIDHLVSVNQFYRKHNLPFDTKALLSIYKNIIKEMPFFQTRSPELYLKLTYPTVAIPFYKFYERAHKKLFPYKGKHLL